MKGRNKEKKKGAEKAKKTREWREEESKEA